MDFDAEAKRLYKDNIIPADWHVAKIEVIATALRTANEAGQLAMRERAAALHDKQAQECFSAAAVLGRCEAKYDLNRRGAAHETAARRIRALQPSQEGGNG